jgi:hypothetical protein
VPGRGDLGDRPEQGRAGALEGHQARGQQAECLAEDGRGNLIFAATRSPLLAAVTYGAAFLLQAIGGTLLGAMADRIRPRPLITTGYGLEAAAAAALALAGLPAGASLALVAAIATLTPVFGAPTAPRCAACPRRWPANG